MRQVDSARQPMFRSPLGTGGAALLLVVWIASGVADLQGHQQQEQACAVPLSLDLVTEIVQTLVPDRAVRTILACGLAFEPSDTALARMRSAGATPEVLAAVIRARVVKVAPPTPGAWATSVGPDGRTLVWIPPGEMELGAPDGDPARRPDDLQGRVAFGNGFWFDVDEISVSQYQGFLREQPRWTPTTIDPTLHDGRYLWDWGGGVPERRRAVAYVPWFAANSYCVSVGARLPTEQEWEYATRRAVGAPVPLSNTTSGVLEWTSSRHLTGSVDGAGVGPDTVMVARGGADGLPGYLRQRTTRFGYPARTSYKTIGFRCAKDE